ncbi:hypothetical protein TTRE_0000641701, partial [Trichuris trichiura]
IDRTLRRIVTNTCPTRQSFSRRALAAKILLEKNGLENLLQHLECAKGEEEKELCALTLAYVKNNWKTRLSYNLMALFEESVISESSFDIFVEENGGKNSLISVWRLRLPTLCLFSNMYPFKLGITSEGLQNHMKIKPKLEVHSSLFSVRQPSVVAFTDDDSMFNLIWQADGMTKTLVDFVVPFQTIDISLALSNGLFLSVRADAIIQFFIAGSLYVSVWYSTANVDVKEKKTLSFSLYHYYSQLTGGTIRRCNLSQVCSQQPIWTSQSFL